MCVHFVLVLFFFLRMPCATMISVLLILKNSVYHIWFFAFITSSKKPISSVSLDLCFLQMCYQFITAFSSTCLHTDCSCFTNCSSYLSDIEVKKWPIILLHFSSTLTYSLLLNCNTILSCHWFPEAKKHRWILNCAVSNSTANKI